MTWKYSADAPLFLKRIREKKRTEKAAERRRRKDEYYSYSLARYKKRYYLLRRYAFSLIFILFLFLVYAFIRVINTPIYENISHPVNVHINPELVGKYVLKNWPSSDAVKDSSPQVKEECNSECPNFENKNSILSGLSEVLWNKLIFSEGEDDERRSLFDEAVENFVSGFSGRAGSASFDGIVSFLNSTKLSDYNVEIFYFNVDEYKLPRSGVEKINGLCSSLNKALGPIVLSGHADSTGSESQNKVLADNRMKTVRNKIKDSCQGYTGGFTLVNSIANPPVSTTSDYSEPENRVVIVEY